MEHCNSASAQTVNRAMMILDLLRQAGTPLHVREISRRVTLSPPTVHRLLTSLRLHGVVQRDPGTGAYWLGWKLVEYANALLQNTGLHQLAAPILRRLRDLTGETVTIRIPAGLECVCVDEVESLQEIRRTVGVGRRSPLHVSASGRAIAPFLPPETLEQLLQKESLPALAPNPVKDPACLLALYQETARTGIARSREETSLGIAGMATPFFRVGGTVAGSIAISGPAFRWTFDQMARFEPDLLAAGIELSCRLGFTGNLPWAGDKRAAGSE